MVGPPKQRALLALLATQQGSVVGPGQIIDALWGPDAPNTALNSVHTYVAGLRRALDPARRGRESDGVLLSRAGGYELCLPPEAVDAVLFVRQCEESRRLGARGHQQAAFEQLGQALGLWRGDALAGVPGPFAAIERSRLREIRFSAAEDWIAGMISAGRREEAIVVVGEAIAQEPLRERLRYLLMLALYRSGRQAHALQAYGDARAHLREELGIEPGTELRGLHARILAGTVDDAVPRSSAAPAAPAAPSSGARRDMAGRAEDGRPVIPGSGLTMCQFPSRARTFVGREVEIEQAREVLARTGTERGRATPIFVIDGPPGVGKSALALELGYELRARFPDGQLYADLAGTGDRPRTPFEILGKLLESLGVSRAALPVDLDGRATLYRSLLHEKRVLILLDDAVDTEQIKPLVPQGSACLIVTGRRPQRGMVARYGAHRISLKPLEPGPAAELLGELLGREVVSGNEDAVRRLVEQCGRIPLGIRITAAALQEDADASPERLAALYEDPVTRLDLLAVAGEDGMSVRSSLTASYRALPATTAHLFRLLSRTGLAVVEVPESGQLLGVNRSEVLRHLELLADLGLLARVGAGSYRFDDLTLTYAGECAEAEWVLSQRLGPARLKQVVADQDELRTG
ncbi:AfsR/SARP family transcriptional regulator [Streptomyces griseoviridis]|uniref:AfsR/SARP family transcriptional regulator n=1 Tax=Streptomyces griseoviridis TaxID=45398 RepID=UPI0013E34E58|nr:BTAD domain-containing putative transcriptional regulator [Streptomyces griseoviridis]